MIVLGAREVPASEFEGLPNLLRISGRNYYFSFRHIQYQ